MESLFRPRVSFTVDENELVGTDIELAIEPSSSRFRNSGYSLSGSLVCPPTSGRGGGVAHSALCGRSGNRLHGVAA